MVSTLVFLKGTRLFKASECSEPEQPIKMVAVAESPRDHTSASADRELQQARSKIPRSAPVRTDSSTINQQRNRLSAIIHQ
jgi:hypothetical protein